MSIIRSPARRSLSLDLGDNNTTTMSQEITKLLAGASSTVCDKKPIGRPRKNVTVITTSNNTPVSDVTLEQIKTLLEQHSIKLNNIVDTLTTFSASVSKKFAAIDTELREANDNIVALNQRVNNNSKNIVEHTTQITHLSDDANNSKQLIERMPNIIVFGIPEDTNENITVVQRVLSDRGKVDQLIDTVLDTYNNIGTIRVTSSRIHPHSGTLTKPRMTKVKFNSTFYKDVFVQRFLEMKKAKQLTNWMNKVIISQDFTPAQLAQRRQLTAQLAQDGITNARVRFVNGVFKIVNNHQQLTLHQ